MDVLAESKTPSFGLFSYLQQPPSHHLSTCLSQRLKTTRKPSVSVGRHVLNHMLSLSLYSMLSVASPRLSTLKQRKSDSLGNSFNFKSGDSRSRHSHCPITKDGKAHLLNVRTTRCVTVRVYHLLWRRQRSSRRVRVGVR